jgi:hypothetical protein
MLSILLLLLLLMLSQQDVATALKKNKDTMEGRWIALFDSTKSDMGM